MSFLFLDSSVRGILRPRPRVGVFDLDPVKKPVGGYQQPQQHSSLPLPTPSLLSPFSFSCFPCFVHCSLFTTHCSLFTVHCSVFTVHPSPFTLHSSLSLYCTLLYFTVPLLYLYCTFTVPLLLNFLLLPLVTLVTWHFILGTLYLALYTWHFTPHCSLHFTH